MMIDRGLRAETNILDSQLTKYQRMAISQVYRRQSESTRHQTYREFRETVVLSCGIIMVPWSGMWLGIEEDGYTHS